MSVGTLNQRTFCLGGNVHLVATDQDGNIKCVRTVPENGIVRQGVNAMIAHALFTGGEYTCDFIGVGSSVSAASDDVSITNECTVAVGTGGTTSRVTALFNQNNSATFEATLEATLQFSEAYTALVAGLFAHYSMTSNTNSIFAKATFDSINLACTDKLTIRWVFSLHACVPGA